MKKLLSVLLVVAMMVGLVSIASAADKSVTVTFWNGWTGSDGELLMDKVDEFNRVNPYGIHIEMDVNAEFQTKIAATFAANDGPDMIIGSHNYKDMYTDYLIDMNELFDVTAVKKDDFIKGYLDLCSKGDKLYVVPFQVTARYMYWNKDLFAEAGLDPDTPPASYEEWAEMAAKITNEDANIYGSGISYNSIFTNLQLIQRFGGLFVDYDENGKLVANFSGNEGYAKFLNWLNDMLKSGDNPMETDTGTMFQAGQIGIIADGAWQSAGAEQAGINYGVAMLPYGDAGAMNPCSVSGFSVTKYASPEAKDACFKFIEWWLNGYEDTEMTGAAAWSLELGFPGYYLPVINSPEYQSNEKLAMMTCTDNNASTVYMAPDEFTLTFQLANETIEVMVEDVVAGGMSVEDALEKAQKNAEALLK